MTEKDTNKEPKGVSRKEFRELQQEVKALNDIVQGFLGNSPKVEREERQKFR